MDLSSSGVCTHIMDPQKLTFNLNNDEHHHNVGVSPGYFQTNSCWLSLFKWMQMVKPSGFMVSPHLTWDLQTNTMTSNGSLSKYNQIQIIDMGLSTTWVQYGTVRACTQVYLSPAGSHHVPIKMPIFGYTPGSKKASYLI